MDALSGARISRVFVPASGQVATYTLIRCLPSNSCDGKPSPMRRKGSCIRAFSDWSCVRSRWARAHKPANQRSHPAASSRRRTGPGRLPRSLRASTAWALGSRVRTAAGRHATPPTTRSPWDATTSSRSSIPAWRSFGRTAKSSTVPSRRTPCSRASAARAKRTTTVMPSCATISWPIAG